MSDPGSDAATSATISLANRREKRVARAEGPDLRSAVRLRRVAQVRSDGPHALGEPVDGGGVRDRRRHDDVAIPWVPATTRPSRNGRESTTAPTSKLRHMPSLCTALSSVSRSQDFTSVSFRRARGAGSRRVGDRAGRGGR